MSVRVAIATTLRNADNVIDSFIRYHRAIGFDHLFLFFDDPDDPTLHVARRYDGVSAIASDAVLHAQWETSSLFAARFVDEVMGRQIVNVEVAIQRARERGIDWVLHMDHDELFYSPKQTVKEHFADLEARGIEGIRYPNHEALPECADVTDYFKEVTLFKRSYCVRNLEKLSPRQQLLIMTTPQIPHKFFHFYSIGKSAARVREGLRPYGVHGFKLPSGKPLTLSPGGPFILHYTCCGFDHFWNKFATLAKVYEGGLERWWGKDIPEDKVSRLYLDAREVVSWGDRQAAQTFYENRYMIADAAHVDQLIESGLCRRIMKPSRVLGREVSDFGF